MTKTLIPTENSTTNIDNIKTPPKLRLHRIVDRLRTICWSNYSLLTGCLNQLPNLPTNRKSPVIKSTHIKNLNNPPYRDWGPTANLSGNVIKIGFTNMYSNMKVYQKYLVTSIKVGHATRFCTRAQVQRLKESRQGDPSPGTYINTKNDIHV